jgi:hypothetical protein
MLLLHKAGITTAKPKVQHTIGEGVTESLLNSEKMSFEIASLLYG